MAHEKGTTQPADAGPVERPVRPASEAFHNPWRTSLENCISGDNYLRAREYLELIEELDDLYRYRCGQHDALNVAYANGRDDEREEAQQRFVTMLEHAMELDGFGCACEPAVKCGTCQARDTAKKVLGPLLRTLKA